MDRPPLGNLYRAPGRIYRLVEYYDDGVRLYDEMSRQNFRMSYEELRELVASQKKVSKKPCNTKKPNSKRKNRK